MNQTPIFLIVGHGSRVKGSNSEFESFVENFCQYTQIDARFCYLELAQPTLETALEKAAQKISEIIVVPLFLFAAGHIKHDIPSVIHKVQRKYTDVRIQISDALGAHPKMGELLIQRARQNVKNQPTASLLIAGRGSSDEEAAQEFHHLVEHVQKTNTFNNVTYGFIDVANPSVEDALKALIQTNPPQIIIQPYLLFRGYLLEQLKKLIQRYQIQNPLIQFTVTDPLGEDSLIFDVLQEKVQRTQNLSTINA